MKIPFWTLFPVLAFVLLILYDQYSKNAFPEMEKDIRDAEIRHQNLERLLEDAKKQNK